ncbi:hypothetical protein CI105_05245 [Candidatus Izimaplasma bacterium ZiA1]|uniref:CvfB family protein n=1 Tax=Candidatus Izimoplasma sp. ZiA1 TaxID=2024899 RepID=UPI000BAA3B0B|nr:hypothetical protein CI105_05245 [Candidatus Izimaplasma bacterium ZiA1]
MKLLMGEINTLNVLRETDIAYVLGDENTEVFLHKREATKELEAGESIDVFLYFDSERRVTATMQKPTVTKDIPAFLNVVDKNFHLGVFLDMGLNKDLLLSRDDLPPLKSEWPEKDDKLFVKIKVSKNQLSAKIVARYDIEQYLTPEKELEEGETVEVYNVFHADEGNVFFTLEGHYIFVYHKLMRNKYRLGEKTEVKIIKNKGDFRYNGTLIMQKELMIDEDAKRVLEYINKKGGVMDITDKSSAVEIQAVFNMSKSAFKRAVGNLYKQKIVSLAPGEVKLIKDIENSN